MRLRCCRRCRALRRSCRRLGCLFIYRNAVLGLQRLTLETLLRRPRGFSLKRLRKVRTLVRRRCGTTMHGECEVSVRFPRTWTSSSSSSRFPFLARIARQSERRCQSDMSERGFLCVLFLFAARVVVTLTRICNGVKRKQVCDSSAETFKLNCLWTKLVSDVQRTPGPIVSAFATENRTSP